MHTVEERDEEEFSSITPSIDSPSLSETKLVDINELEKSLENIASTQKTKPEKDRKKKHDKSGLGN